MKLIFLEKTALRKQFWKYIFCSQFWIIFLSVPTVASITALVSLGLKFTFSELQEKYEGR